MFDYINKFIFFITTISLTIEIIRYIMLKKECIKKSKQLHEYFTKYYTEVYDNPIHRIGAFGNNSIYNDCFIAHNGFLVDAAPRELNNYQVFKYIIEDFTNHCLKPEIIDILINRAKLSNTNITERFMLYCNHVSKDNDSLILIFSDPYNSIKVYSSYKNKGKVRDYLNRVCLVDIIITPEGKFNLKNIRKTIFCYTSIVDSKEIYRVGGFCHELV